MSKNRMILLCAMLLALIISFIGGSFI